LWAEGGFYISHLDGGRTKINNTHIIKSKIKKSIIPTGVVEPCLTLITEHIPQYTEEAAKKLRIAKALRAKR
jgi:hypothetical protein